MTMQQPSRKLINENSAVAEAAEAEQSPYINFEHQTIEALRGARISDIEELNIDIENDLYDTERNPFL